jgi:urease accessory protein
VTAAAIRRNDPCWYTPADLPSELVALDRPGAGGLPVGAPGRVGLLELSVARRGGTTRVEHQYQRAPLHVYRPIHLDPHLPEMAFVFVQQFGDGFVQGDRCRMDVDCGPGTALHLTTQAATNLYRSDGSCATQLVNLRVEAGAVLEHLPDPVVPFAGSRFFQRTLLTVDADATAIVGDVLLPGRVARGELHAYDVYWTETEARRPDGTLLFADALRLGPGVGARPGSEGLLGGCDVVAALYVATQLTPPHELVECLREALGGDDLLAGASELPNGCGAVARILGPSSRAVGAAFTEAWNAVRLAVLGVPAPDRRKG